MKLIHFYRYSLDNVFENNLKPILTMLFLFFKQ